MYPTKDYATFEDALDEFYAEPVVGRDPPQSAALAVAGPVVDNRCKMTNLSWLIDGHDLSRRRGVLCAPGRLAALPPSLLPHVPPKSTGCRKQGHSLTACTQKAAQALPGVVASRWWITVCMRRFLLLLRLLSCCRFAVLNDFEAIGYGVPVVPEEDLVVLHDAPVSPKVGPVVDYGRNTPVRRGRCSIA